MSKKVLIVDDEDNIRELLWITLEDEGYELHQAVDGIEGIQKAKEVKPDIVLLDVMMPGKMGYEVCEEIRKDPEIKNTIVFFLSSRTSPSSEVAAKQAGGDLWLYKPFEPSELREKVKEALGIK